MIRITTVRVTTRTLASVSNCSAACLLVGGNLITKPGFCRRIVLPANSNSDPHDTKRRVLSVGKLVAAGCVLTLGSALIALSGQGVAQLAFGSLLLGAQSAANPVLVAALARLLPPARAALGYTGFQLGFAIGLAGGAFLSGVLYDRDPLLPLIAQAALALPVLVTVALIITRVLSRAVRPLAGSSG